MLKLPRKRLAMYWAVELFTPGCGPFGLADDERPLPLATRRCFPSGVTRTEVGYHPTGMKPSERLLPGLLASNTATKLLSAFATKRVFSSGDNATLFGVEPEGASGNSAAQIVSRGLPV